MRPSTPLCPGPRAFANHIVKWSDVPHHPSSPCFPRRRRHGAAPGFAVLRGRAAAACHQLRDGDARLPDALQRRHGGRQGGGRALNCSRCCRQPLGAGMTGTWALRQGEAGGPLCRAPFQTGLHFLSFLFKCFTSSTLPTRSAPHSQPTGTRRAPSGGPPHAPSPATPAGPHGAEPPAVAALGGGARVLHAAQPQAVRGALVSPSSFTHVLLCCCCTHAPCCQ